jgi:hypothetical protein
VQVFLDSLSARCKSGETDRYLEGGANFIRRRGSDNFAELVREMQEIDEQLGLADGGGVLEATDMSAGQNGE